LPLPRLNRIALWQVSGDIFMASNTWDGSVEPDEHADPEDTAIPCKSRAIRRDSDSTNSKLKFSVFGNLRVLCPLNLT